MRIFRLSLDTPQRERVFIWSMLVVTLGAAVVMTVNPWPRDGWWETQYALFARMPEGADNLSPIAGPAVFFKLMHGVAAAFGMDLRGEFYLVSLAQNLLIFFSAWWVYLACKYVSSVNVAAAVAAAFLVHTLSTGLGQAFWSESLMLAVLAGALLLNMQLYAESGGPERRFWWRTLLSAVLIGVAVVTRVVPILLIPAFLWLLHGRVTHRRLLRYGVVTCVVTALFVILMMTSNYVRYGRMEMTSSSGRHLWQGVTEIVGEVAVDNPELAELKALNAGLQGMPYGQVELPFGVSESRRDEILGRAATAVILQAPLEFIEAGLVDFAETIGRPVYRLGFGERDIHSDPLATDVALEPLLTKVPFLPEIVLRILNRGVVETYLLGRVLYPAVVFFVMVTCLGLPLRYLQKGLSRPGPSRGLLSPHASVIVHLVLGVLLIAFVDFGGLPFEGLERYAPPILCALLLLLQLALIVRANRRSLVYAPPSRITGVVYVSSAAIFFGSLWFSWQVEAENTRNVVPYLPFLALLLAMSIMDWRNPRAAGAVTD